MGIKEFVTRFPFFVLSEAYKSKTDASAHSSEAALCRQCVVGLRNCYGPLTTRVCHTSGKQSGLCSGDVPTIADDKLFESILHNPLHVLNSLIPDETVCSYELKHSYRRHNRELNNKTSRLAGSDFIIRMTYKDTY